MRALEPDVRELVNVKDVADITSVPYVARELMLVKVRSDNESRSSILETVQMFFNDAQTAGYNID